MASTLLSDRGGAELLGHRNELWVGLMVQASQPVGGIMVGTTVSSVPKEPPEIREASTLLVTIVEASLETYVNTKMV